MIADVVAHRDHDDRVSGYPPEPLSEPFLDVAFEIARKLGTEMQCERPPINPEVLPSNILCEVANELADLSAGNLVQWPRNQDGYRRTSHLTSVAPHLAEPSNPRDSLPICRATMRAPELSKPARGTAELAPSL